MEGAEEEEEEDVEEMGSEVEVGTGFSRGGEERGPEADCEEAIPFDAFIKQTNSNQLEIKKNPFVVTTSKPQAGLSSSWFTVYFTRHRLVYSMRHLLY